MLKNLIDRFKEPSSWASIAAVLTAVGVNIPSDLNNTLAFFVAGVAGLIGFFLKEKVK